VGGGGAARPAWLEGAALVHLDGRHAEMALHAARLGLESGLELGLALHAARCAPLLSP